jgi:SAM-dependent methyltransferase
MDQLGMWNDWHRRHEANDDMPLHRDCLNEFISSLPESGKSGPILELGCAQGYDSVAIATAGYSVEAMDFSDVAIDRARRNLLTLPKLRINYICRDMSLPLPYADSTFSGVFAYLSLHYFRPSVTIRVFREIARVTSASGIISFSVRSVEDSLFGRGERLDHHLYELNGHIRHFFDEGEIQDLLRCAWTVSRQRIVRSHYLSSTKPEASVFSVLAVRNGGDDASA